MSFRQSEKIPSDYTHLAAKIRAVTCELASVCLSTRTMDVGNYDALIAKCITSEGPAVKDALQSMGITKVVTHVVCADCRLVEEQCFCDGGFKRYAKTQVYIEGELSILLNDLTLPANQAIPYFISLCLHEGKEFGEEIHAALLGKGFLCTEAIGSNAEWRRKIERGLREAKTLIIVETPSYYTRPFCELELLFGVAAGQRVVRVGLADGARNQPTFMNSLQRVDYRTGTHKHTLALDKLMSTRLEDAPSISIRKEAARGLVNMCDEVYLRTLADKLNILNVMPSHGSSLGQLRNDFIAKVFGASSGLKADEFIDHFDFSQVDR